MSIETLLLAFCLVLIIESIGPALFPNRWRNYMKLLANEPSRVVQNIGIVLFLIGALGLYVLL